MTPTAAILVIGDEILSGRTREGNAHFLAGALGAAGIALEEIRVVPDEAGRIVAAVRELSARVDHLFTSGGIGPTHDDITADAVAAAFGAPIGIRDDARAILEAHFAARGVEASAARMRMARIPEGATLIANPVSAAPGFTLGNVHVMAGVPAVFEAMVGALLPTLEGGTPMRAQAWEVRRPESSIADALRDLAARMPDLSFGSYPFERAGGYGTSLVVRGRDAARVAEGHAALAALFPAQDA